MEDKEIKKDEKLKKFQEKPEFTSYQDYIKTDKEKLEDDLNKFELVSFL